MIISDLSHLEVVSEAPSVAGGLRRFLELFSRTRSGTDIGVTVASTTGFDVIVNSSSLPFVQVVNLPWGSTSAVAAFASDASNEGKPAKATAFVAVGVTP